MRRAPRHTRRGVCGEEEGRTLTKGKRAYLRAYLPACLRACLPACLPTCLALPRTTTPLGEGIVEPVYRRLLPKARLRRVSSRPAWSLLGTYSTPTLPLLYPYSTPTLPLLYSYSTRALWGAAYGVHSPMERLHRPDVGVRSLWHMAVHL